ncbi:hypothetical protein JCM19297_1133 [Nonlabens ulvanivorans]|nr:hypothetical protein JCM19297_1133 [Nonlabens ulvanivorans]
MMSPILYQSLKLIVMKLTKITAFIIFVGATFISCSSDTDDSSSDTGTDTVVVDVEQSNFVSGVTITTVPCTLSDGTVTDCYQIETTGAATDHQMDHGVQITLQMTLLLEEYG